MEKLKVFNFDGIRYAITEDEEIVKDLSNEQYFVFTWNDLYHSSSELAVFVMTYFTIKSECVYVIELN